uniref:NUMB domain-containing protein n=1 Tax=Chinchilla lanigera TaxID=34839 RepID=A0A8C2VJD4_CHILA
MNTGERLSHAVGCAFAPCLERKQKREKECGVTVTFDARTTFTREGSFRVTTATEQAEREEIMKQMQDVKKETDKTAAGTSVASGNTARSPSSPASPASDTTASLEMNNPHAIPRRFPALSQKMSPFKRQLSLRINQLPSTMQKTDFPIKNAGPKVEGEAESISSLCSQITNAFSTPSKDPFSSAPMTKPVTVVPAHTALAPVAMPVPKTNPWAHAPDTANKEVSAGHRLTPLEADRWLEEGSKSIGAQQLQAPATPLQPVLQPPPPAAISQPSQLFQGSAFLPSQPMPVDVVPPLQPAFVPAQSYPVANGMPYAAPSVPVVGITPSQMVSNAFGTAGHSQVSHPQRSPSLVKQQTFPQYETSSVTASHFFKSPAQHLNDSAAFSSVADGRVASGDKHAELPASAGPRWGPAAHWAALESKAKQRTNPSPTNPFSSDLQKTFEIEL